MSNFVYKFIVVDFFFYLLSIVTVVGEYIEALGNLLLFCLAPLPGPGWPQTCSNHPALAFQVLGSLASGIMFGWGKNLEGCRDVCQPH